MGRRGKKPLSAQQEANRRFRENARILDRQQLVANVRGKYGPRMQAAPVVVKSLETGEVLRTVEQKRYRKPKVYSAWLDERAQEIGYENYESYLASPHWQAMRQKALAAARYCCWKCGGKNDLGVHHDHYNTLGREKLSDLKVMCFRCHRQIHKKHQKDRSKRRRPRV